MRCATIIPRVKAETDPPRGTYSFPVGRLTCLPMVRVKLNYNSDNRAHAVRSFPGETNIPCLLKRETSYPRRHDTFLESAVGIAFLIPIFCLVRLLCKSLLEGKSTIASLSRLRAQWLADACGHQSPSSVHSVTTRICDNKDTTRDEISIEAGPASTAGDLLEKTCDKSASNTNQLRVSPSRESIRAKSSEFTKSLKHYLIEPLSVLMLLRLPPVFLTVLIAIASCSVYILNIAIESGFADSPYNFNQTTVGLAYMSTGIGYILSSMAGGRWMDSIMAREARKVVRSDSHGKLISLPEDHMKENAWVANTLYPLSLLWFGWTMYYGVQFMVPISALFVFGFTLMLHFTLGTTMLTEFVRKRSSAGVTVNNFVRNILSCVGTIVAAPWMKGVGLRYMMTKLCIICLLLGSLGIWLITRNAQRWRGTLDKALKEMD